MKSHMERMPELPLSSRVLLKLRKYVKVKKVHGGWNVVLNAGVQYFTVTPVPVETKAEANWMAQMLVTCLIRIVVESVVGTEAKKSR